MQIIILRLTLCLSCQNRIQAATLVKSQKGTSGTQLSRDERRFLAQNAPETIWLRSSPGWGVLASAHREVSK